MNLFDMSLYEEKAGWRPVEHWTRADAGSILERPWESTGQARAALKYSAILRKGRSNEVNAWLHTPTTDSSNNSFSNR